MRILRTVALGAAVVMAAGVAVATQPTGQQRPADEVGAVHVGIGARETHRTGRAAGRLRRADRDARRARVPTTTLKPGASPHAPHTHKNEELIIVKEGAVEAFVNGRWKPAPTGSLIFFASMVPHTVRNTGTVPARTTS